MPRARELLAAARGWAFLLLVAPVIVLLTWATSRGLGPGAPDR
jgi:hypothetical protein